MRPILRIHTQFETKPMGENAKDVLIDGVNRLGKCWVADGTALGLYRDGDFIKGDTDLDVYVEGYDDIEFDIFDRMLGYELIRSVYYDDKPQQLCFMKDGIIFDIYIHWYKDGKLVNYAEQGYHEIEADVCRNIVYLDTKYGKFPFPNPIEYYLENRYGSDWKIPQNKKVIFQQI